MWEPMAPLILNHRMTLALESPPLLAAMLSKTHHLWNSTIQIKLFTVSCYGYEQWPPLSSLALPPLPVCLEPLWSACRRLRRLAFHASSRELTCEPHWCHTSRRRCKLSAARRLAHTARRTPCTALSSLCWKQQSAKFNIQTSRSLQPFCLPVSFPFLLVFFFLLTFGKKDYIMWILLDFGKLH